MHLLHVFPSFQLGGSQRRFAALVNHFGNRYRHTVVSLDGCGDALSLVENSVALDFVAAPGKEKLTRTISKARRTIREYAPDVLITYNWGAMEWAAANAFGRARHVHIEDGFGPEEANGQIWRRVFFRRVVLNLNSTVVLPSRTLVNLATKVWRIAPRRVSYIPNGIPCARFNGVVGGEHGFRGEGPVIGTVATLRKEKALGRLVNAFRSLRQTQAARLVIVGDGTERQGLEELVEALGLGDCVTFTGSLSRPETAVRRFDVFALSSETEQMPLSILEAMAAGLPVAATNVGDISQMVAESNLPYVVAKDDQALAGAMSALLRDGPLRAQIGAANRDRAVREFDESAMFSRYDSLFSGQA